MNVIAQQGSIGAQVRGLDLRTALSASQITAIRQACPVPREMLPARRRSSVTRSCPSAGADAPGPIPSHDRAIVLQGDGMRFACRDGHHPGQANRRGRLPIAAQPPGNH